jgi:hypothetical protein
VEKAVGYAVFVVLSFLVGWFALPLLVLSLPLVFILSLLRLGARAHVAAVAIISGAIWGLVMLFNAWVACHLLGANANWITGIGVALMVFASPKVPNARFAVPSGIVLFFCLSLSLL